MKKTFIPAVAAMAVLSACTKEAVDSPEIVEAPVFTATIKSDVATRTTLADRPDDGKKLKVNWEKGDEVMIYFVNKEDIERGPGGTYCNVVYQATPYEDDPDTAVLTIKDGETYDSAADLLCAAVYPASQMEENDEFIFPATQVYKGDDYIGFAPMVYMNMSLFATGETTYPESIQFQNACALLKITVPHSEMSSVSSITVSSDLQMNGSVSLDTRDDGMLIFDSPSYPDLENGENKVTLDCYSYTGSNVTIPKDSSKTFYIAIVARENVESAPYLKYLQIDVTDGTTVKSMRTKEFEGTAGSGIEINPNTIYPITFAANRAQVLNPNLLPGEFTVGNTKKVRFTKGNLFCNTTTAPVTWGFEASQLEYPDVWSEEHVGHFFWSKDASVAYAKDYNEEGTGTADNLFCDENHQMMVAGATSLYVLTENDWHFLFHYRKNAESLYRNGVSIEGMDNCFIIAPDGYSGTIEDSYTDEDWATAEAAGLVSLPAAGYRENSSVKEHFSIGYYWYASSDKFDAGCASLLCFDWFNYGNRTMQRGNGCSIRLVQTVK